jgi:hypothetical protein
MKLQQHSSALKKGFFFTVIAVILLTFIIASIAAWSKVVQTREAKVAENFRLQSMKTMLDSAGETAVASYSQKALYYSVWKVANYSSCYGLLPSPLPCPVGNPNSCTEVVSNITASLFLNGTYPTIPALSYSPDELQYAITNFSLMLNSSTSPAGISIWLENPRNISINQTDAWTVSLKYNVTLAARTTDGLMSLRKNLTISTNISIEGFVDPFISRGDHGIYSLGGRQVACSLSAKRQIFRHQDYRVPLDLRPISIVNNTAGTPRAKEGKGWYYGNITDVRVSDIIGGPAPAPGPGPWPMVFNPDAFAQSILVTDYYENLTSDSNFYGGVIITTQPIYNTTDLPDVNGCIIRTTQQEECVDCLRTVESLNFTNPICPGYPSSPILSNGIYANAVTVPYIVTDGSSIPFEATNTQEYALFDNEHDTGVEKRTGYHRIYDMGRLRDATVCGYYLGHSSAPSFFQRMLSLGSYSSPYGIQTFVVGTWAGGMDDEPTDGAHDDRSRLDRRYYGTTPPFFPMTKIKGMPGCKSAYMCNDSNTNTTSDGVGRFRLDVGSIADYGVGPISCNVSIGASCEG